MLFKFFPPEVVDFFVLLGIVCQKGLKHCKYIREVLQKLYYLF